MIEKSSRLKNTANLQLVKETNLTLIYNLILKQEPVSRAELAQTTRLSPTTVSSLVEELLSQGIILETGAGTTSTSGRKPIMLEINPIGRYVISVILMEKSIEGYLYDLRCSKLSTQKADISSFEDIDKKIISIIEVLTNENSISEDKLEGIIIGVPALIDYETNSVISSSVLPIENNNNFIEAIKQRYSNTHIILENESSLYAYAEQIYGSESKVGNLVFMDINLGIGSGIIINGKMYTGSYGLAGEIGHISIDMNGPKCKCGNKGCLEVMAGIPAMIQKVIFGMMSGRNSVINNFTNGDFNKINVEILKMAIDMKDEMVMEVLEEIAVKLSFGINNIINLFDPEVIVIGGEITKLGPQFLEYINTSLNSIELVAKRNKVKVKYSSISGNGAALGGARYILDRMSKTSSIFNKL